MWKSGEQSVELVDPIDIRKSIGLYEYLKQCDGGSYRLRSWAFKPAKDRIGQIKILFVLFHLKDKDACIQTDFAMSAQKLLNLLWGYRQLSRSSPR
jgi:hypothetical protein